MGIYLWIVAATVVLGLLMPQQGKQRKYYVILMTVLHTFICGFRYNHLTGDLMKYHYTFLQSVNYGWFSDQVFNEGRNGGFYMLMKLINHLTNGDFQMVLIVVALVCHISLAVVVYRYSPTPWISYLVWNCLGFYVFGFNAIKQALAMAFVMLSLIGIFERRPKFYLAMMLLAGFIHAPAFIFLPAYWLADQKVSIYGLVAYVCIGILVFLFRNQVVDFITQFYYEEHDEFVDSGRVGNRVYMIVIIALCGVAITGFQSPNFQALFHFMCISAMLQILASFDNIFTRLTDYYFQTAVLFIPMLFHPVRGERISGAAKPMFLFNRRSMRLIASLVCAVLIWFYFTYTLDGGVVDKSDRHYEYNYLNFRFMWDVK